MRVVFAGTPEVALPALDAVHASAHELVGVVTRPDAPSGRGRRLHPSPVAARAAELGVPVLKPEHPRDPDFQDALRTLAPDCCPVVAYGGAGRHPCSTRSGRATRSPGPPPSAWSRSWTQGRRTG
jgi:methionyl-tRNA formyltransferase